MDRAMIDLMSQPARNATAADLLATYGEDSRVEIIHGEMVEKAMGRIAHARPHARILAALTHRFDRERGGRWPGGWLIGNELHVEYESHELFCHDLCGYRRDLHPQLPDEWPTRIRPDWVCELLSPKHERRDLHDKWWVLHRARVPHYWIVNPEEKVLQVLRWEQAGYTCVLTATAGSIIRAEPFDAVELRANVLFGDEDDDE
jgi:Uma2 family endonuclease